MLNLVIIAGAATLFRQPEFSPVEVVEINPVGDHLTSEMLESGTLLRQALPVEEIVDKIMNTVPPVPVEDGRQGQEEQEAGQEYLAWMREQNLPMAIVRIAALEKDVNIFQPWKKTSDFKHFVGSGFIIENDETKGPLIVTNAHVVSDAFNLCVALTPQGKTCYAAQALLVNHQWDLALVRIKSQSKTRPSLAEWQKKTTVNGASILHVFPLQTTDFSSIASQGSNVAAMGFPLGKESLAVTTGVVSGSEVVKDSVVLQTTAPISPGNSGGPLVLLEGSMKGRVVGVNFASAAASGSQNNNFAIPAWRVKQQFEFFKENEKNCDAFSEQEKAERACFTEQNCIADVTLCEMKVPVVADPASFVPMTEMLAKTTGCGEQGAYITNVNARSAFANTGIKEGMVITSVDGIALDRFGYGTNTNFLDEKASFMDMFNFKPDLSSASTVTVCSCGKSEDIKVSHEWKSSYNHVLMDDTQQNLVKRDFIYFGGVGIQPLSMAIASSLIMSKNIFRLVPYALSTNKECPLVVTYSADHDDNTPAIGSIVEEINGQKIGAHYSCHEAMAAAIKAFPEVTTSDSTCSAHVPSLQDAHKSAPGANSMWSLKTADGEWLGVNYQAALTEMAAKPAKYLANVVVEAIKNAGIKLPEDTTDTEADSEVTEGDEVQLEEMETDPDKDAVPIEDRDFYRGGTTAVKALQAIVEPETFPESMRARLRSSFLEIGPGGMAPVSLLQQKQKHQR
jgi:S1-C subfamily serine protease